MKILTIGPHKGVRVYKSARAVSRALSGTGSNHLHDTVTRRVNSGGGYVGGTWVEFSKYQA